MNWNMSILATPANPANFLVAAIYDASAPSVLVQSIPLPKPYSGQSINISFLNVDAIVYDFILWESATTSPSGQVRNTFSLQPTSQTVQVRADMVLIADVTPGFASGVNNYVDSSLTGWSYSLERRGVGTLQPQNEYSTTTTSWALVVPGDIIAPNETFILHFYPIAATLPIQTSNFATAQQVITGNKTLLNTDVGQAFLIQGGGSSLTIVLPALSTIPNFKILPFYSTGGNHINVNIVTQGGDIFEWPNTIRITLGQGEQLKVYKANGKYNVDFLSPTWLMVGELVPHYAPVAVIRNCLPADGRLVSRATYARLWDYVQTLESGVVVPEANWANTDTDGNFVNKGRYSFGDGSTTFRVPDLRVYGFRRAIDGITRKPGDFKAGQVGKHNHPADETDTNPSTGKFFVRRKPGGPGGPGNIGLNNSTTAWESININTGLNSTDSSGENRPSTIGHYEYIRI